MNQQGNAVILLADPDGKRVLPIWIGPCEAHAIAMKLEDETFERPLTHDLFVNTIDRLGYELQRIEVTKLENKVFFAELYLATDSDVITIDSRPSDAIALAVRTGASIYVAEEVLERAEILRREVDEAAEGRGTQRPQEVERFRELMNSVDLPTEEGLAGDGNAPEEEEGDGDEEKGDGDEEKGDGEEEEDEGSQVDEEDDECESPEHD